jgi:fibronectin type 3 domain-containing protein
VNSIGTGPLSAAVAATPRTTPPEVAGQLTAARAAGSVTLSWTAADRAESYQILRGGLTDETLDVIATTPEPAWTDTGVANHTTVG